MPPLLCPTQVSTNLTSLLEIPAFAMIFPDSTKNGIVLSAVENPVDWPVYSDSVKGNKEEQVYIILKDFNGYVAVRHDKKANVAFADGHVAANNEQELMRFRDSRYYADRNFFSYCK